MAKKIPYSEACQNLEQLCQDTIATGEAIEIARPGSHSVSIIATAELESLIETVYLFQSHKNAARLLDALARAQAGSNPPGTVDALRQEFGLVETEKLPA